MTTADESEMDRAEEILNDAGAVDIDERSQQWCEEGWSRGKFGSTTALRCRAATAAGAGTAGASLAEGATQTLQEVEEELKVGKRAIARGGIRVFSRVIEVPVEGSVRFREEHANVQRRTVDRPATEADFAAFKEGSIEVREMAEEAVVSKTARVVGEVEVGKEVTQRDETIRDTVGKTKVDVEQLEPTSTSTRSSGSDIDSDGKKSS